MIIKSKKKKMTKKILWTTEEIVAATQGQCTDQSVSITGISIDTRTIEAGDLFIALKGNNSDGHAYLDQAAKAGAVAALVQKGTVNDNLTLIEVDDPFEALNQMARHRCSFFKGTVVALTGSVGKTSLKEVLAHLMSKQASVHHALKSLNNHIGVPLTLARMPVDSDYAVMELGMNHANEIEVLSKMVEPDIAIINNVAPVHIENFDGLIGIAKAKSEIFLGMSHEGVAILNADTAYLDVQIAAAQTQNLKKIKFFGAGDKVDLKLDTVTQDHTGCTVKASLNGKDIAYQTKLFGQHQALNALPALLVIEELGLNIDQALSDLALLTPVAGRGNRLHISIDDKQITIIDDRHNASPEAMNAAFDTLAHSHDPKNGDLILVLGDMLELGEDAPAMHADLAGQIEKLDYATVLLCGQLMAHLAEQLPSEKVRHFKDSTDLAAHIKEYAQDRAVFFVKGSRGSQMWHPINALLDLDVKTNHDKVGP